MWGTSDGEKHFAPSWQSFTNAEIVRLRRHTSFTKIIASLCHGYIRDRLPNARHTSLLHENRNAVQHAALLLNAAVGGAARPPSGGRDREIKLAALAREEGNR